MAGETLGEVIRRLGRAGGLQGDLAQTDGQLLERFARRRDEPAFAGLLARHGPAVLGVCRQLLHDSQDAEDAFQAVFLVLARKAGVIQRQSPVGPWLYGVAWRVAVRLRGRTTRRREREDSGADLNALPAHDATCDEVRWVVHEEVQRLPDVYRSAVVLCCLEGKTNEEAARLLRRPVGTVKSRLTRARELLRTRLTRRGMALAGGVPGTVLAAHAVPAPAALVDATIRAAVPFAAGEAVGVFGSARAVALSQGVLQTMLLTKVKITAALALVLVVFGTVGGLAYRAWAGEPGQTSQAAARSADKPVPPEQPAAPKEIQDADAIQGTWVAVSAEAEGKAAPAEALKDFQLVITADKLVFNPKGENRASSYKLDPAKTPKVIEVTPQDGPNKGMTTHGLYELDGDRLKLCLQNGGGKEPTEFATQPSSGLSLLILKRKPADKPKDDKETLQGTWRVIALETEGVRETPSQKWAFTADKLVIKNDGREAEVQDTEYTFAIDPTQSPKTLDLTRPSGMEGVKGSTTPWIYSLEGDVLKIGRLLSAPEIKHLDQQVGRRPRVAELRDLFVTRPTELSTKEGSKSTLLTLERVK